MNTEPTDELNGATELGDPRCWASPGEFAARWNARTDEQRRAWLLAAQGAMQATERHEAALAAAVTAEREKVETVLRNAEKHLADDDPMAYGQGWYDGQTTLISRIREVSR